MVTSDDLSQFKGGTIHLIEQAENLVGLGHRVTIYAPSDGRLPRACAAAIHYLPSPSNGALRQGIFDLFLFLTLFLACVRGRVSIIHVRQMSYSVSALAVAKLLRVPHVLEVNGILRDERPGLSKARGMLLDICARLNLQGSHAFTTTTSEHIARLEELYRANRRKATVIPCGVNVELFGPGDKFAARRELDITRDAFVLIHVGSLYSWRGVDRLLEGLARIGDRIASWRLLLVGDGAERQALEACSEHLGIAERVAFVGLVDYALVPRYLVASDVGVVFYAPTRSVPGDPMKIYEYMACGLPVLASNFPRYGDLVREAGAGLVVDSEDPLVLADAVVQMAAAPEKRREFAEAGVRAAAEHSWRSRTRMLETVLLQQMEREK